MSTAEVALIEAVDAACAAGYFTRIEAEIAVGGLCRSGELPGWASDRIARWRAEKEEG